MLLGNSESYRQTDGEIRDDSHERPVATLTYPSQTRAFHGVIEQVVECVAASSNVDTTVPAERTNCFLLRTLSVQRFKDYSSVRIQNLMLLV